jgi:class 3 adenylate cyclase
MPLFMDRHDLEGATPEEVAAAHVQDVEIQDQYGVRYVTYWHQPEDGYVFCLAEGPDQDAVEAVHRDAHGELANKIIEVDPAMVRHFLGRIEEPVVGEPWVETAFRAVLFTDIENSTSLTQLHGDAKAMAVVRAHDEFVRDLLARHGGTEIKHTGDGIMATFPSAARAIDCAIAIQRGCDTHAVEHPTAPLRMRIGLNAGEPVAEERDLFGTAVQLAARVCASAGPGQILVSDVVRQLSAGKRFLWSDMGHVPLRGFDDPVRLYEVKWRS